jgi:ABC-2 type transport system ATP-binding protein
MIETHRLTLHHGPIAALTDASVTIQPGELVALLGPNGAGKTTFLRLLATVLRPQSGWARICGYDTVVAPLEARRRIGYLPELPPLDLAMEVEEFLRFVGQARGLWGAELTRRLDWTMTRTGLGPRRFQPIGQLSKGYRQRVALAQALLHDPEVLLLDEPTSGLDPVQIQEIRDLVRELAPHKTILFSTHILQEAAAMAQRICIIASGRIQAQGTRAELAAQAHVPGRILAHIRAPLRAVHSALSDVNELSKLTLEDQDPVVVLHGPCTAPEALCQTIGERAATHGWTIHRLEAHAPDLETLFFSLTAPEDCHAEIVRIATS